VWCAGESDGKRVPVAIFIAHNVGKFGRGETSENEEKTRPFRCKLTEKVPFVLVSYPRRRHPSSRQKRVHSVARSQGSTGQRGGAIQTTSSPRASLAGVR
jgi:hypothetical protein